MKFFCRFCLNIINSDKNVIMIDDETKKFFYDITQEKV